MGSLFQSRSNVVRIREAARSRILKMYREGTPIGAIEAGDVTRDTVARIDGRSWRFGGRPAQRRKVVSMLREGRPLKQRTDF